MNQILYQNQLASLLLKKTNNKLRNNRKKLI